MDNDENSGKKWMFNDNYDNYHRPSTRKNDDESLNEEDVIVIVRSGLGSDHSFPKVNLTNDYNQKPCLNNINDDLKSKSVIQKSRCTFVAKEQSDVDIKRFAEATATEGDSLKTDQNKKHISLQNTHPKSSKVRSIARRFTRGKSLFTKHWNEGEEATKQKPYRFRSVPGVNHKEHLNGISKLLQNRSFIVRGDEYDDEMDNDSCHTTSTSANINNRMKRYIELLLRPDDSSRMAVKLFGSKRALIKEQDRQKEEGYRWVIHPLSPFRFYWDVFMLLLLAANLIILPVTITFFNNDLSIYWLVFNCFSDTMFLLDIVVNFRTGIMPEDKTEHIILDPKIIAKNYFKTWFILDFVSSFPFDYFLLIFNPMLVRNDGHKFQMIQAGRALRILRLAKLLSLLRLLRVSRLVRYVSQWEEVYFLNLATVFIRIFNLVSIMLLVGHWSGCLQFLVPQLQGFPHDCWIVIANIEKADWFEQYSWSFFKAMSHMLSIGYGRFPPQNLTDMWLTIFSMVSGATCYALFIGHATNLIQSLESANRQYRELMKQVDEYMAYRKLPRGLKVRIQDYFEHKYHGKMFNENMILKELSDTLRQAVINFNCRDLVASVPFFANADCNFVAAIIGNLEYEVFQPGDIIVKEGAVGDKMYFIQEGVVDVISNHEVKTSLSEGSYFGEICLMTSDQKRQATIQAASYCHLFSLTRHHFNQVLEYYPMMRKTMESIAAERLQKIGRDPSIVSPKEDLSTYVETVQEVLKDKENELLLLQSIKEKEMQNEEKHKLTIEALARNGMRNESFSSFRKSFSKSALSSINRSNSYSNYTGSNKRSDKGSTKKRGSKAFVGLYKDNGEDDYSAGEDGNGGESKKGSGNILSCTMASLGARLGKRKSHAYEGSILDRRVQSEIMAPAKLRNSLDVTSKRGSLLDDINRGGGIEFTLTPPSNEHIYDGNNQ